ncbi:MAG: NAD+ synthase [Nitrososphaerales archaeon]|nr:NAD+ synthase [Nitrososphaerales archaeon]
MPSSRGVLELNYSAVEKGIVRFIRKVMKGSGAQGVILGLSGGIDSSVVGALCVKALGSDRVSALLLPSDFTPIGDVEDASELAELWHVKAYKLNISNATDTLNSLAGMEGTKIAKANVQARVRMILLYFFANTLGLLVAGTGDKSEEILGFYSKWGDGGVDFLPIAHLYKTQVRALGRHLGLPQRIVEKPASPQLWSGHTAAEELPGDYDVLDPLLYWMFDRKLPLASAAKKAGVSVGIAKTMKKMYEASAHKRSLPPMVRPR